MQVKNCCIKLKLNDGDYSLVTMSLPWPSFIAVLDTISTSMDLENTYLADRLDENGYTIQSALDHMYKNAEYVINKPHHIAL